MYRFLTLAAGIGESIDKTFYGFDTAIFSFFGSIQNDFFRAVAKIFTALGDENFVIPIALIGLVLCFFKKTRKLGWALMLSIAIGTLVTNIAVKPMFERIRPYNTLQGTDFWAQYYPWYKHAGMLSESDYSFPSGHTTAAFEIATAMFICFRGDAKLAKSEGKKTAKGWLAFIFPVIALCVMGSRIYLMVHYPTDVIGGLIVGVCAGIVGCILAGLICRLFEKTPALDKIDLGRISKKEGGISTKVIAIVACVAVIAAFCYSYIPSLSEGGAANPEKVCEYDGDYKCYNEARFDEEKYPAFDYDNDGDADHFCKIHWKELNPNKEAA